MAILKKSKISIKESLILLTLLAIVLFLPLIILHFFEKSWGELVWQNPTDLAMLEWTGAFLNIFLFLLMLENYRTSGRTLFNFIASGFLAMGILNFIYAIQSPATETAMWLRTFSILCGAILFSFSIPLRKRHNFDLAGALIKFIIPAILLAALAGWIPFSLKQILPKLLKPNGTITIFGSILFIIPCAFFFFTALIWLHEYLRHKRKVDFILAVIILIFAQMTLIMRDAEIWGVLWWLWHIIWVVDLLVASIYMLILSVNRSLVWKLVFSLGLAFALTVLIASSIIQSNSEKKAQENFRLQLHERHKRILLENCENFTYAKLILRTMTSDANDFCNQSESYKVLFRVWLEAYFKKRSIEWQPISGGYGFYSSRGEITVPDISMHISSKQRELIKDFKKASEFNHKKISWTRFYFSSADKKWYSYALKKFKKGDMEGFFFVNVDVSGIVKTNLLENNQTLESNTIVFKMDNGEILHASLSKTDLFNMDENLFQNKIKSQFVRKLTAAAYDMRDKGKIILTNAGGIKYFISAQKIDFPSWGVMKILNTEDFPVIKPKTRYFFIAVGMITLLVGFIILLLLLHRQLSRPFNRLLQATEKLEDGDFDVKIKTNDETEIGSISRAFNDMALTLKELYSDLAKTVSERTEALEGAKRADSAKVTFFQNISHELRTPLHGILSFSRLGMSLKPDESPEKVHKYFKNINNSGERLMLMLDSILDLAKLESGNMSFNFRLADITYSLQRVKEELEAVFLEKNIELIKTVPEDEEMLTYIDTEMLERVFRNLLGNALKLSPSSSKVEVILEKLEDQIKVIVMDEGPGIPEESLNNIFDKFVQVGDGKSKGGTGLGLPICREIIHAHGGLISAKNRKQGGACFTFSIPLRKLEKKEERHDKK